MSQSSELSVMRRSGALQPERDTEMCNAGGTADVVCNGLRPGLGRRSIFFYKDPLLLYCADSFRFISDPDADLDFFTN